MCVRPVNESGTVLDRSLQISLAAPRRAARRQFEMRRPGGK
jgi:hypothetical protein